VPTENDLGEEMRMLYEVLEKGMLDSVYIVIYCYIMLSHVC
jgi:hypothetical protein